jgi:hypothetical protein
LAVFPGQRFFEVSVGGFFEGEDAGDITGDGSADAFSDLMVKTPVGVLAPPGFAFWLFGLWEVWGSDKVAV